MERQSKPITQKPLRILSLDGGGVRGISTLYILKEIMRQVAREHAANDPSAPDISPRPCEYFDLICGTSTGGLIALMLGRLRMSVDDAILKYKILSRKVFSSSSNHPKAAFDEKILEQEIKNIVASAVVGGQSPSMQLKDIHPDTCPTFVVATSLQASGAVRMRSFATRHNDPFPASIWQVARATSAAPTYFLPITIDDVDYGDGGTGWNNPAKEAIAEARNKWPDRPIGILVSIGTGLEDALQLNDTSKEVSNVIQLVLQNTSPGHSFKLAVAEYAVKCITSCELIHQEVSEHCDREILEGNYFRLNVPQGMAAIGLAEWDKLGDMIALTNQYMDHGDMKKMKQKIAELLLDPQRAKIKSDYLPIFNIPYRRNPLFTGRADTLKMIHRKLVLDARPDFTSSYVIYGLGGVGKTQLAIEYSYQYREYFDIIYWLRADDYETLLTSYSQLYDDSIFRGFTGLNLGKESNLEIIAAQLKRWFEECQHIRWLLVIDNADKFERDAVTTTLRQRQTETIGSLIPRGSSGSVLVTSRSRSTIRQLKSNGEEIHVMDEDEAMEFLFKCLNADSNKTEDAADLVRDLGRLPLAIEQAGGFMQETGVMIPEYRRLYNKNRSNALREGLSDTHRFEYYRETVSTTWNVSFNAVHQRDRLASIILQIAAFLDGKQIQKDLFYNAKLSINDADEILSEWKVNKALGTLMSYSLVRPIENQESVEMHSLVQSVIRDDDKTERMQYFMWAAELVRKRFPWGADANNLKDCRKYVSQAQNCVAIAEELHIENSNIERILQSMAAYFWLAGQFRESLCSNQKALKIIESRFGVDHVNSADTIVRMGLVYYAQGKYIETISWYDRALRIFEREFGADHINSATTINNIGEVYRQQGKYAEAISWYERALNIFERQFGVDHIQTANSIGNIGSVYHAQGKYAEAISSYERALKIFDQEYGVDHINSANIVNNIGEVCRKQGRYAEAISWYERALKIKEQQFGVDHINSANTINNIGIVYHKQGRYAEAISWYERALKIDEQMFGVDHINSVFTLNNIARVYSKQANYAKALSSCKKALKILEQELGMDNIRSADAINTIGEIYQQQGMNAEALSWFERALNIFNRKFGADHINSADTINNIGEVYNERGKYAEAMSWFKKALEIKEREFGVDHVNSARILHNIGLVYKHTASWVSATSYFERAARLHRQCRGARHEFTLRSERELSYAINALNNSSRDVDGH